MINNLTKKIFTANIIRAFFLLVLSTTSTADLTSLSDNALSDEALGLVSGQALFKIEEYDSTSQADISFTRLTLGLKVEMNVNIDELSLGTFYRQPGNSCNTTFEGRFCTNNIGNFSEWNCSETTCGGITDDHGNNPFSAAAVVYGEHLELTSSEVQDATFGSLGGDHYASSVMFKDDPNKDSAYFFPSGFERTETTDIKLRHLSFGRVIEERDTNGDLTGVQRLEDFIIEKPFIEFVHDDTGGVRKIAGLRVGFGSSDGTQGQAIDVVSGFIQPVITATASANLFGLQGSGTFTFAPYLGGTRTAGYIDPDETKTLVGGCARSGSALVSAVVCGKVDTAEKITESSPQAQLFPLQNLVLSKSPNIWISMQSKDIDYESDIGAHPDGSGQQIKFDYETAKAGFWFNLGALGVTYEGGPKDGQTILTKDNDGLYNNLQELSQVTGIAGNTNKPKHPDNYFSAHPSSDKFPQSFNYY